MRNYVIFNFVPANPSSLAMADLMHSSLRENNLKRLFYIPYLLVIDTCGTTDLCPSERKIRVEKLVKVAQHFGFNVYVTSVETPENIQTADGKNSNFEYSLPNKDSTLRMNESLTSIKDNTAREELIENLLAQVLVKGAKALGCQKIFVSDSATSLAVKLMSGKRIEMVRENTLCLC